MKTRDLLCGVCLIAFQASLLGVVQAQTLASPADSPVSDKPVAVDKTSKAPGNIPEVVKPPLGDEATERPKAIADPGTVLTPPSVSLTFLRSMRLDWDQLGASEDVTSR